jgi:hypothetical protein
MSVELSRRQTAACLGIVLVALALFVELGHASYPPGQGLSQGLSALRENAAAVPPSNRRPVFQSDAPVTNSELVRPVDPDQVIYDQLADISQAAVSSQNFEAAYNSFDTQAADDFFVPPGQTWQITDIDVAGVYSVTGSAHSVNVVFYLDSNQQLSLPAAPIITQTSIVPIDGLQHGSFSILLDTPVVLQQGHYWVSVQSNQDFTTNGQWFWRLRSANSNSTVAWRNPGGGFNRSGCLDWGPYLCSPAQMIRDLAFRLGGAINVTPTSTVTGTPPTAVATRTPVPPQATATGTVNIPPPMLTANLPVGTPTDTVTGTPPTSTNTSTPTVPTSTTTRTSTTSPTATVFYSATPTSQPGPACPAGYEDIPSNSPDFGYARCATCNGIMESFACGSSQSEPCGPASYPYFRPSTGFSATYAEIAKTLSTAAGFNDPAGSQQFQDVPPGHPFYAVIFRMADRGIMVGFACGGPGEPCVPPNNFPYFRPDSHGTVRGEFARYLSNTAGFSEPVSGQLFEDVPPVSPYYDFVQRIGLRGLMEGFACGNAGEPCGPQNLPYFRPGVALGTVSRIEYAHILVDTFLPGCPAQVSPTVTNTNTPPIPPTPSHTSTGGPTATATRTSTRTNTAAPTQTPGGNTATPEATHTSTRIPTGTATSAATPTACSIEFTDVLPGSTFYDFVRCMACRGIINGYTSGCETGDPCFRPNNNVTRGQLSKIVSNAAGFTEPAGTQQYEDVVPGSTFYDVIWRLADRGYVAGYPCGGEGEPCGPASLPYFRPNGNATRGQISKIVSNAAGYAEPAGSQVFDDVAPGSTFFDFVQRLANRGVMGGYACGGPGEPCGPGNRPYFRPSNQATRGQTSKIVSNTFYPDCQTP